MATALNLPSNKPATTYRTRVDALEAKELPAMILYAIEESGSRLPGPAPGVRRRKVRLEMMVEGQPPADTLVDPLYVFAVNTLLADATLAGMLRRLEETSFMWETEASYQDACVAVCDFRGSVCHQQRSISQKGLLIVMDQRLFFLKSHVLYGAVHTAGQFYMVPARYVDDLLRDGIAETEAQHDEGLRAEANRLAAIDAAHDNDSAAQQQSRPKARAEFRNSVSLRLCGEQDF
jgi:hypothetical protein